ncbi:MAG: methyltransferase [Halioglobus sp.]
MHSEKSLRSLLSSQTLLSLCFFTALLANSVASDPERAQHYEAVRPSADGIGRVYLGREISQVMGHRGASWLERPQRVQEERTDLLMESLALDPNDVVADLGAGTGYFSFPMAMEVPNGSVLAVDIQPEMLAIIERRVVKFGVPNVFPVLASECDPALDENSVDVVLLVDAYHEFSCPREVMASVATALKPDGRVMLVEYRGEDPDIGIKPLHTMALEQATTEMEAVGLSLVSVSDVLPKQHLMTFQKK